METNKNKNILLVGEDLIASDLSLREIAANGYSVDVASDIYQAVPIILDSGNKPATLVSSNELKKTESKAFLKFCKDNDIKVTVIGKLDSNFPDLKFYPFIEEYLLETEIPKSPGVFNKIQVTDEELNALLGD